MNVVSIELHYVYFKICMLVQCLVCVHQVTTLVAQKGPSRTKKGQSPKAHVLSAAVQMATEHFIMKGEEIANENQEIRNDMLAAVDDVRVTGMSVCCLIIRVYS